MKKLYDENFYKAQRGSSIESARAVVPILIEQFHPASVVDVGCGVGTWLKEFLRSGVDDCLGLDGSWVRKEALEIPERYFVPADLSRSPKLDRKFDMAVSLEVAEHLPAEMADQFVHLLTSAAPIVVFSAAVPGQGGTGHINEQWQDHWCAKFRKCGYVPFDLIRPRIWNDPSVCWWYAQNLLVYVSEARAGEYQLENAANGPLNVVHPLMMQTLLLPQSLGIRRVVGAFPHALRSAMRRAFRLN